MRRPLLSIGLVLLLAAGCAPRQDAGTPTAEIPERIVSLSPALTEIVFALGRGDRLAGVTDFCDFPPEARELPKMGGFSNPSLETVLDAGPDLVLISKNAGNQRPGLAMIDAGLNVLVVPSATFDDTFVAIRTVGEAIGADPAPLIADLESRLESVRAGLPENGRPRVAFLVSLEPLILAGPDTLPGQALAHAGGRAAFDLNGYPRIGLESLIEAEPDAILFASMDPKDADESERVAQWFARWPSLRTDEPGRLQVFDASRILRPGPRLAEGVEDLAARLATLASEPTS